MLSFIGKIITQLREENELTIGMLSERTGISVEKISDIESGAIVPSIGVMIKISRALGARLGTLLDGHESSGAVVSRGKQIAASDNLTSTRTGVNRFMEFFALGRGKKDRSMEPLVVVIQPSGSEPDVTSEHEGEEFLYVLEGSIRVHYGVEKHILEVGDSIYYDSIVPHSIASADDHVAKILAVVYTPY
ncbi:MAG: XRE family transcriptional regulator [Mucinivorans sp.]